MEFNYSNASKLGISFLWIKHLRRKWGRTKFSSPYEAKPGLWVVEASNRFYYVEAFFYDSLRFLSPKSWHLNLANDEIVSLKVFNHAMEKTLDRGKVYSLERKWIYKDLRQLGSRSWLFSHLPTRATDSLDRQFRIAAPYFQKPDYRLHSCCFKYKSSSPLLVESLAILHLDWILKTPFARLEKLVDYEMKRPGAGLNRVQYYMPELFSDEEHRWQSCSEEEIELIQSWYKLHMTYS